MRRASGLALLTLLAMLAGSGTALGHKPSDAHLRLAARGPVLDGRLDVALRDLDAALALDDGDGTITWGELEAARPRIETYLQARLAFTTAGAPCPIALGVPALTSMSDGAYWAQPLTAQCPGAPAALTVTYGLLFDVDAQHRGLLHVDEQTVIVRDAAPVRVELGATTSFATFVREGIWHILIGLDHVLFLICLLLPAVVPRTAGRAEAPGSLRRVSIEVLEIVTAFTLAHSITLVISAAGIVQLPSRFVETAIALSVVAAALNNLVRAIDARWAVAFALGLLHGFGFSSVLLDLGLPSHELITSLLAFNIGVELGQLAIVLIVLPLLYALRHTLVYRALLWVGSSAIAALGMLWTYERLVG